MANGYVRQSSATIASGQPVASTPVNNEFNSLANAFSGTTGHDHSGGTGLGPTLLSSSLGVSTGLQGIFVAQGSASSPAGGFSTITITGMSAQIDVTNGNGIAGNPVISIDSGYVGQTSITTVGTIATGTWQGTIVSPLYGGTGADNGVFTLNLGGNLTTAGAFQTTGTYPVVFGFSGNTSLTFPTSGTVATTAGGGSTTIVTVGTVTTGTWAANVIQPAYGGTGVANANTVTVAGNFSTTGANSINLNTTAATNVTLPVSGTLATLTTATLAGLTTASNLVTVGTISSGTWQGTAVGIAYGGTGGAITASNGGIVYSTASKLALLSGTATANQILLSGSSTTPAWSTATYPATTTTNQILYSSGTNAVAGLATAASSVLVTSSGSVPSLSTALPNGITATTQSQNNNSTKVATTAYVDQSGFVNQVNTQTFTGNGTYTPTSGMEYCIVEVVGGGGGGGACAAVNGGAGGGGAGGYARVLLTAAQVGASKTITIGAAGTAGASGGANAGGTGGTTSIGSLVSCTGGGGGTGAASNNAAYAGGSGGSPTVNTGVSILGITGQAGSQGGNNFLTVGGSGGSNPLGFGGPINITYTGDNAGNSAAGYGAGGGGACTDANSKAGAPGTAGAVIITEYI